MMIQSFFQPQSRGGPSLVYRLVRRVFQCCAHVFYRHIEVSFDTPETQALLQYPAKNECTILCPNHGNSLTDAILVVSETPHELVRLTAKDTLFEQSNLFSLCVKSLGTLPLQRRDEHGDQVNTAEMIDSLVDALSKHDRACVCLFPEGKSRYQSHLSLPLKSGVSRLAREVILRTSKAAVNIVCCSISYCHREKFRSDVSMHYSLACRLEQQTLVPRGMKEKELLQTCQMTTAAVAKEFSSHVTSAQSWELLTAAHTARQIYAPELSSVCETRMLTFVHFTQFFVQLLDQKSSLKKNRRRRRRLLLSSLWEYQRALDQWNLDDQQLVDYYRTTMSTMNNSWTSFSQKTTKLLQETVRGTLLLMLAMPGLVLSSPVWISCRTVERQMHRVNYQKDGHVVKNMDEIAQSKIATGVTWALLVSSSLVLFSTALMTHGQMLLMMLVTTILAYLWWIVLACVEEGISALGSARAIFVLWTQDQDEIQKLIQRREALEIQIQDMVARETTTLARLQKSRRSSRTMKNRFFCQLNHYTSGSWGHALRLSPATYAYPKEVCDTQRQSQMKDHMK